MNEKFGVLFDAIFQCESWKNKEETNDILFQWRLKRRKQKHLEQENSDFLPSLRPSRKNSPHFFDSGDDFLQTVPKKETKCKITQTQNNRAESTTQTKYKCE